MYKNIKLYIAGDVVPFTEISGNRPVLFNTSKATTYDEFKSYIDKFKKQFNFLEVATGDYQYKRDSLIEATINLETTKFPKFTYNYCIVEFDDEILVYYITKIKAIQNNVNRLFLKLDTISTYFWKIPLDELVEVDRLNYNIGKNKKLLEQTLKVKDDSIGNIVKDTKIIPKPKKELKLKGYVYRILTSNQIKKVENYGHLPFNDGLTLKYENSKIYKLESNSNQILHSFVAPYNNILYFWDNKTYHIYNIDTYKFWSSNTYTFGEDAIFDVSEIKYKKKLVIKYIMYCIEHKTMENLAIVLYDDEIKKFPTKKWGVGLELPIGEDTLENIINILQEKNFQELSYIPNIFPQDSFSNIVNGKYLSFINFSPELKKQVSYKIPSIFTYIPPIKELVDINLFSWSGTNISVSYFNINDNNNLVLDYFRSNGKYEVKTYITFNNGLETIGNSPINNKYEISNMVSISQRVDSKTEYLASNSNQIEMEKKAAKDNAILGVFKGIFSAIGNFFKSFGGGVSNSAKAVGNVVDVASSVVNYNNKIGMIDARIEDAGNKRSQYNGGETCDINLLMRNQNTKYFDNFGLNVVIQMPSELLYNNLKFHYYKYGCKLLTYLTIEECFDNTFEENFTYIKFNNLSQLYLSTDIPQEALYWINDILISGIHFWKWKKENIVLPNFSIPPTATYSSNQIYYVATKDGNVEETKLLDI